jgi:hypothetical protein
VAALALVGLLVPTLLAAQVRGLPVVASGVSAGPTLGVTYGTANDDAGGTSTIGASLGTGLGPLALTAMVSRGAPLTGDDAVWSQGLAVSVAVFGGPLVPFRVTAQAGVATWNRGVVDNMHVPLALGFAATIPNPAFAIRPWLAPRVSFRRSSFSTIAEVSETQTNAGLSGGIDLAFLNGLVVRAAYDREFVDNASPGILSFGLGYALGRR